MDWLCYLWWALLGGLIGWLLNRLFAKRPVQTIEKIVTRDVEKIVEKPVDRIVEKLVDNPLHMTRIQSLEGEVGGMAALRATISRLEATPAKIVEKIVEKPVEIIKTVEKIVEKPVEVIKTVEKIVDRPVEVIKTVEKIVEKPVDRIVEKLVDNPVHLTRIKALETDVGLLAGLRATISRLEATPPKIVEKIVDRPVEVIKTVEKIVDRPVEVIKTVEKIVDRPVEVIRTVEKIVDRPVEVIKTVEKIVDRPVEVIKTVEKIVDRPVEVIKTVEKMVDRVVEKLVDNPVHLTRIRALEADVGLLAGLRATISRLEATPPKIVEKIVDRPVEVIKTVEKIVDRPVEVIKTVEKIVDRPVEVIKTVEKIVDRPVEVIKTVERIVDRPVEKIVEKFIDRPVEKIVEKIVEKPVDRIVEKLIDNPAHLNRIKSLETEVALIVGLRATVSRLESMPPKTVEKIVERPVEVIKTVEKIVEKPVDRVVEKRVDNPEHLARIKALEAELAGLKVHTVALDRDAAKAAGFNVKGMDDLEVIEGIGPKISDLFHNAGIHTFHELSKSTLEQRQAILDKAGPNFRIANPGTWAEQAALAAANKWAQLRRLQEDELIVGVRYGLVAFDAAAAKAAGFAVKGMDDLEVIEGIGPKIKELFHAAGVMKFHELAHTSKPKMQEILTAAGARFALADPSTWAQQARLAASNKWAELRKLQDELSGGVRK